MAMAVMALAVQGMIATLDSRILPNTYALVCFLFACGSILQSSSTRRLGGGDDNSPMDRSEAPGNTSGVDAAG